MSEAVRYLSEKHDDGRSLTGEYRLKVSVPLGDGMAPAGGGWMESSEVVRVYFAERPDAEAAYERLKRSEEHTSELQSRFELVCRLLLEKKNTVNQVDIKRTN